MKSRSRRTGHVYRAMLALLVAALGVATPHGGGQPPAPSAMDPADPFPNFDIRADKDDPRPAADAGVAAYMEAVAAAPAAAADALAGGRNALAALRGELPGVQVQANAFGGAEVVSAMPGTRFLTGPGEDRVATLRGFLRTHEAAYGLAGGGADELVVVADEMNPAGNMAWVELEQRINGIRVFQGHVRGAFTAKGELARTNGLLATGVGAGLTSSPALSAAQAVAIAAARVGLPATAASLRERERRGDTIVFAAGAMADEPRAWLVYFPLAHGVARLAWATEVYGDPRGFLTVVDAQTGTVLFRKNLTSFQTQAATYDVYTGDSPAPASPSPALPGMSYVAPVVSRQNVTRIGNEAPYTFNNLGWITDGANGVNGLTDGNNVEAGVDLVAPNGVDAAVAGTSRTFTFAYNPALGADAPTTANYRNGEVTNLFYWANRFHDEAYLLGFTEQFRNYQHDNFGRGGLGNDRISAEAQDSSGTNNANFTAGTDGARGRLQMFVWTGPTPDFGGGLDADVALHELTHGLSSRLHSNGSGLGSNMSGGLGEGWSDFFARSLLADASEDVNGLYTLGGWSTTAAAAGFENYYYGIRRFPYAVRTAVGANGRPHNPLTFADIDTTQADLTDGAFPASTVFGVATRDQVHEAGQIWAVMLFEVRARFITRLGFAEGNRRILQLVTDGMKGDPVNPTFLSARDSILAAAAAGGTPADVDDIWAGFAARGLGVLAEITVNGTGGATRVVESFLAPGDPVPTFTVNDVSALEGNAGTTTFAFTVSLANPSPGPSTVTYATANGTATSAAGAPVGTSATGISLPAGAPGTTMGAAAPYPVTLNLAGLTGTITRLAVRLDGLTHTFPSDLDMLLVGPGGQRAMFMSDIGGGGDAANLTLTFEDGAAVPSATQLVAGTFAPTDTAPGDVMDAPAPAGPYTSALSVFNGTSPNGTWSLFIMDDASQDAGSLTSFTLSMATTTTPGDYQSASGVLTFPPGTTSQPVNVSVFGDAAVEPHESFVVNLSNPSNAVIGDNQGVGTILNDDGTPPTSAGDAYSTPFDTALAVPDPGVLANDASNGGGALTAILVSPPSHGTLNLVAGGGFTYTPATGFAGADAFTYRAQSAIGLDSGVATVAITVSQPTEVQAPTAFYVSSVAGNRVTLRWTPAAAGPPPAGFLVQGGVAPGQVLASLPVGPVPILTFDAPNGAFFVRVHAVGATVSAASNEAALFVNVPAAPSAPANLLGMVNGSTLSLGWRNTFGGGAPTGAVLDVTGAATTSIPLGAGESLTVSGVPAGTYTLRLRSTSAGGASLPSNPVTVAFPGACSGAPDLPTRFLAYRIGGTLFAIWESPAAGAAPTSYLLQVTGALALDLPLTTTRVSGAVPSGAYNLSVRAVNACGASAPTAVQSVTMP